MRNYRHTKSQAVADVFTGICMIFFLWLYLWGYVSSRGFWGWGVSILLIVTVFIHVLLGTIAVIVALSSKRHKRNSWIYIYFCLVIIFTLVETKTFRAWGEAIGFSYDRSQHEAEQRLFTAIRDKDLSVIERQLKSGVDLSYCFAEERRRRRPYSLLRYSVEKGSLETTRLLLAAGASPNFQCDKPGLGAVKSAISKQDVATLRLLLSHGASGVVDTSSHGVLALAIAGGRYTLPYSSADAQRILGNRDDADVLVMVKMLIDAGVPVNTKMFDATALHWALIAQDDALIELLLQAGANPNIRDPVRGDTPLFMARRLGSSYTVELLKKHGAVVMP
jgi:hypothetical protein